MKTAPWLDLNMDHVRRNISRMADRARKAGVAFRPHFKTHCSSAIGKEFKLYGVRDITVSSSAMGMYFARSGWTDVTVAFIAHPAELPELAELAGSCRLGVLADSPDAMRAIDAALPTGCRLWAEVDCGAGRTGVKWDDTLAIVGLAKAASKLTRMEFAGILTHAGQSYSAVGREAVLDVSGESLRRMAEVRSIFDANGLEAPKVSVGDTPTCSLADSFPGANEIRPGNFVFYDLMQMAIGSCDGGSLAVRVICPVAATSPGRLVLHCGAIHLSKECMDWQGKTIFGAVSRPDKWPEGPYLPGSPIISLSQEHAVVDDSEGLLKDLKPGESVAIHPVHACLTCWQFTEYRSGALRLEKMH
jgi:D-serine deaminase-like pyridoxal phosphate-dependent protein